MIVNVNSQKAQKPAHNCNAFAMDTMHSESIQISSKEYVAKHKVLTGNNNQDRLFLLNPNFIDSRLQPQGQVYFCPFNAMLEGVLKYYPTLHQYLNITYIDFQRPRKTIVQILGEENQSMPLLIIENSEVDLAAVNSKEFNSHVFVVGPENILKYLAKAYDVPLPHP